MKSQASWRFKVSQKSGKSCETCQKLNNSRGCQSARLSSFFLFWDRRHSNSQILVRYDTTPAVEFGVSFQNSLLLQSGIWHPILCNIPEPTKMGIETRAARKSYSTEISLGPSLIKVRVHGSQTTPAVPKNLDSEEPNSHTPRVHDKKIPPSPRDPNKTKERKTSANALPLASEPFMHILQKHGA